MVGPGPPPFLLPPRCVGAAQWVVWRWATEVRAGGGVVCYRNDCTSIYPVTVSMHHQRSPPTTTTISAAAALLLVVVLPSPLDHDNCRLGGPERCSYQLTAGYKATAPDRPATDIQVPVHSFNVQHSGTHHHAPALQYATAVTCPSLLNE